MKFKPIKNLFSILCAAIISISLALPVSAVKTKTPSQATIQQVKINNNLSTSIINQTYNLLNSSDITKNLTPPELFSAKSKLSELKSLFENLSISQMNQAQEIFKKLNILHKYISNKSSPPNIIELAKNIDETSKYIKNLPLGQNSSISIKNNAEEVLKKIKELKIQDRNLSKFQEFTSYLDKTLNSAPGPQAPTAEKLDSLNLFFINILNSNPQAARYYVLNKLPQKIDEFISAVTKHQIASDEKTENIPLRQANRNINKVAKNPTMRPASNKSAENAPKASIKPTAAPQKQAKTVFEARAEEASKIEVLADESLKETWEKHIQAGIQGTNDCWLFSAINVQNWFNFKDNQKIVRGQARAHEEFLSRGESKGLLGRAQNQFVIAKYLKKCGFNSYVVLSCLEKSDKENLNFNKSLAEILIKTHFLKSQTPIIIHKENHWAVVAAINTAKNQALVVDSAFSKPFWQNFQDLYDSISGTYGFFENKPCYALGLIFVTNEQKKMDKPKAISIFQSSVNFSSTIDIFNVNQFLTNAIDAASK